MMLITEGDNRLWARRWPSPATYVCALGIRLEYVHPGCCGSVSVRGHTNWDSEGVRFNKQHQRALPHCARRQARLATLELTTLRGGVEVGHRGETVMEARGKVDVFGFVNYGNSGSVYNTDSLQCSAYSKPSIFVQKCHKIDGNLVYCLFALDI